MVLWTRDTSFMFVGHGLLSHYTCTSGSNKGSRFGSLCILSMESRTHEETCNSTVLTTTGGKVALVLLALYSHYIQTHSCYCSFPVIVLMRWKICTRVQVTYIGANVKLRTRVMLTRTQEWVRVLVMLLLTIRNTSLLLVPIHSHLAVCHSLYHLPPFTPVDWVLCLYNVLFHFVAFTKFLSNSIWSLGSITFSLEILMQLMPVYNINGSINRKSTAVLILSECGVLVRDLRWANELPI